MKLKSLLYIIPLGVLATVFFSSNQESELKYLPRAYDSQTSSTNDFFDYFSMINADPKTGKVNREDVLSLRESMKRLPQNDNRGPEDLNFREMGPDNIAGRVRAIESDPENPEILWAGGISGGLFKTEDGGLSWSYLPGFNRNLIVSAICLMPNGTIYVGTGNSNESGSGQGGSSFLGNGLFKSTDNGESFSLVSDFEPNNLTTSDDWIYVNRILRNPLNENSLWIAYAGGFREYIDGNTVLEPRANGLPSGSGDATDADISADGQVVTCVISDNVYISSDGGVNFEDVSGTGNALPTIGIGRVEFALCPNDPNNMYAFMSDNSGYLNSCWASDDGGETFDQIAFDSYIDMENDDGDIIPVGGAADFSPCISADGQCWYDQDITVNPTNCDEVIIGGVRLYKWEKAIEDPIFGQWDQIAFQFGSAPGSFVHSDIHYFHWTADDVLYVGTDGGIFRSEDFGGSFFPVNRFLNVTQLYDMDFGPEGQVLGGSQDNGCMYIDFTGITLQEARDIPGSGDGFDVEHSQLNNKVMFTTSQNSVLLRSADGGINTSQFGPYPGGPFYTVQEYWETDSDPNNPDFVQIPNIPASSLVDSLYVAELDATIRIDSTDYFSADSLSFIMLDTLFGATDTLLPNSFLASYEINDTDVSIVFDTSILGTIITDRILYVGHQFDYFSKSMGLPLSHNITVPVLPLDSADLPDPVSTWLATSRNGSFPLALTRRAANFNSSVFNWFFPIDGISGTITKMKFSPDGDHLYIGTSSGRVTRISGLANAYRAEEINYADRGIGNGSSIINVATGDTVFGNTNEVDFRFDTYRTLDSLEIPTKIYVKQIKSTTSGAVTGIAVDPNNPERVAISIGGYTESPDHVMLSESAQTTTSSDAFTGIWNNPGGINGMERMPIYSVTFDMNNENRIIAGTEYGIWVSEDDGDNWEECNNLGLEGGIGRVPVMELLQQTLEGTFNYGQIYAGTHGRGFWESGEFLVGIDDNLDSEFALIDELSIFPNPLSDNGTISFNLIERADVEMNIYDLGGNLISSQTKLNMSSGQRTLQFNAADFASGIYIVNVRVKDQVQFGKFVKL